MSKISENQNAISSCINFWRDTAYRSVCDSMIECFDNLGMIIEDLEDEQGSAIVFDKPVSGFPVQTMKKIYEKYSEGVLETWIGSMEMLDKAGLIMTFLNFGKLRMDDFKKRYPNAFKKWTEEDDVALEGAYKAKVPWSNMSDIFGRNTNALKIRLEKLGVDLGKNGGSKRF